MNRIIYYLYHLALVLWTFRGRPACRIAAVHGLWLDYRGEVLSRLSSR
jgi:hypothetical protein